MEINDLLPMTLQEVGDLLLQEICKRGKSYCHVTIPGHDEKGERVILTIEVKYDRTD